MVWFRRLLRTSGTTEDAVLSCNMLTLGTAGHIDHGKTTLTSLLTGKDTDRLPEEKSRGISIELGFARMQTAQGDWVGLIDVPGHERFVHTMVSGASGIQGFLLVLAADEGIMPQTREHLSILRLLGVDKGLVVLSKTDLAEPDWVELVTEEVREFLEAEGFPPAPVVPYSSQDPESVERVRAGVDELTQRLTPPPERGLFRLPIDRAFSVKGHGTVITGTVASGRVEVGAELKFFPGGHTSRVRSIQAFDSAQDSSRAGERAALNVPDVNLEQVGRGSVAVRPDTLEPESVLDVRVELLRGLPEAFREIKSGSRLRVHVGTTSTSGRLHLLGERVLAEGQRALAQLRLDEPLVAAAGDRFLLRATSPVLTVGGGAILEVGVPRYKRGARVLPRLMRIEEEGPAGQVLARLESTPFVLESVTQLSGHLHLTEKEVRGILKATGKSVLARRDGPGGPYYGLPGRTERAERLVLEAIGVFHKSHPEEAGIPRDALTQAGNLSLAVPVLSSLVRHLSASGACVEAEGRVRLPGHESSVDASHEQARTDILTYFEDAEVPFQGVVNLAEVARLPETKAAKALEAMVKTGDLMRLPGPLYCPAPKIRSLRAAILEKLDEQKPEPVSTADFKALLGLPRKALIPLLENMDEASMTLRAGGGRIRKPGYRGAGE